MSLEIYKININSQEKYFIRHKKVLRQFEEFNSFDVNFFVTLPRSHKHRYLFSYIVARPTTIAKY